MMPDLELVQVAGVLLSLILTVSALAIRQTRDIDTTSVWSDWSLLLVAAAGLCMADYFWLLSDADKTQHCAFAVLLAVVLYQSALSLWYIGCVRQRMQKKSRHVRGGRSHEAR